MKKTVVRGNLRFTQDKLRSEAIPFAIGRVFHNTCDERPFSVIARSPKSKGTKQSPALLAERFVLHPSSIEVADCFATPSTRFRTGPSLVPFHILRRGSGLRLVMTINIDARSGNGPYTFWTYSKHWQQECPILFR